MRFASIVLLAACWKSSPATEPLPSRPPPADAAVDAPACDAGTDCVALTESCLAAGCFDRPPGGMVGVASAPAQTVIWAAPGDRSGRRRTRASGRRQRRRLES